MSKQTRDIIRMNLIKPKQFLRLIGNQSRTFTVLRPYYYPLFKQMYYYRQRSILKIIEKAKITFKDSLDVGGGFGMFSANLKLRFPLINHYLIDIMPSDWGEITKRVLNENLNLNISVKYECDIQKTLPFENNQFDMIFALDVLEHLKEVKIALCELLRVLKPGGFLFISVPVESILLRWARTILSKLKTIPKRYHWLGDISSEKEFNTLMNRMDMDIKMMRNYPFKTFPRIFTYDNFYLVQKR